MKRAIFAGILLCAATPAIAQTGLTTEARAEMTSNAILALSQGKAAEVITLIDPVLASFAAENMDEKRAIYCADDTAETLTLMLMAASKNINAIAIAPTWCSALFAKGFALIDLRRPAEAEPFLHKAAEMAPLNAHYINEYAEWHKANRHWQQSYDLFEQARGVVEFTEKDFQKEVEARSLRGMGCAMVQLGKVDEAETLFKQSLKLLPNHQGALGELDYIKKLRRK